MAELCGSVGENSLGALVDLDTYSFYALSERDFAMGLELIKLEDLVCMSDSHAVCAEADGIVLSLFPDFDLRPFHRVFDDVLKLFKGEFPGYRKCNIHYHDLKHTTDCLLAMARLIHGACIDGVGIAQRDVSLGLIASLLHDTGYIQESGDEAGTGAKYTLMHVKRSIRFAEAYFASDGYSCEDLNYCRSYLECTGLDVHIKEISFNSAERGLLGRMLGAADLLGQMANRTYLEKLPFLFHEFEEGGVPGFQNEFDLLRKTPDFWKFCKYRFSNELEGVDAFMRPHFRVRWGVDRDLYREAIENNISYLEEVLRDHPGDYRNYLRRGGFGKIPL